MSSCIMVYYHENILYCEGSHYPDLLTDTMREGVYTTSGLKRHSHCLHTGLNNCGGIVYCLTIVYVAPQGVGHSGGSFNQKTLSVTGSTYQES